MEIKGTLVWYYMICPREVWLMHKNIIPDQKDTNIDLGRFIHENSYSRNKKEIDFGHVKFDVLMSHSEEMVIGETKKSSKFQKASRMQLLYYLKVLKDARIKAKGVLLYPEEKKRVEVQLDSEGELELQKAEEEITEILTLSVPPPVKKNPYCRNCGYREYCYS